MLLTIPPNQLSGGYDDHILAGMKKMGNIRINTIERYKDADEKNSEAICKACKNNCGLLMEVEAAAKWKKDDK